MATPTTFEIKNKEPAISKHPIIDSPWTRFSTKVLLIITKWHQAFSAIPTFLDVLEATRTKSLILRYQLLSIEFVTIGG